MCGESRKRLCPPVRHNRLEAWVRQRPQGEQGPIANKYPSYGCNLYPAPDITQQEQNKVSETNLRQRINEEKVGLLASEAPQEDSKKNQ